MRQFSEIAIEWSATVAEHTKLHSNLAGILEKSTCNHGRPKPSRAKEATSCRDPIAPRGRRPASTQRPRSNRNTPLALRFPSRIIGVRDRPHPRSTGPDWLPSGDTRDSPTRQSGSRWAPDRDPSPDGSVRHPDWARALTRGDPADGSGCGTPTADFDRVLVHLNATLVDAGAEDGTIAVLHRHRCAAGDVVGLTGARIVVLPDDRAPRSVEGTPRSRALEGRRDAHAVVRERFTPTRRDRAITD